MSSDLQIGLSGVLASQKAMLVTAHNISNANTNGYSKQKVSMTTRLPWVTNAGTLGQGVDVEKIIRQKNEYIDNRFRNVTASLAAVSSKAQHLRELETVFNETSESSINNALSSFFKFVNDLSQNTESMSSRTVLLEKATTLSDTFQRTVSELDQVKTFVKQSIETKVKEVNNISESLIGLNKQISSLVCRGLEANDLMDKRDALLLDLSKLINITVNNRSNGMIDVLTSGGMLVSDTSSISLTTMVDTSGTLFVTTDSGKNSKLKPSAGEIQGLLDIYNNSIPSYDKKLDTLAASLIKEINCIHSEGVGLSGGFTSLLGNNAVSSTTATLNKSGLPFTPSSGDMYVTVTDSSTGVVTKTKISVDVTTDTLDSLKTKLDAITGITASITDKKLQVQADTGKIYNFSYALDPNPDTSGITGTSSPSVSGVYTGQNNDVYTFKVIGSSGTIGTTSGLQVEVRDSNLTLIATLDVGSGYTAGNTLDVGNGVSLSFGAGTLNVNDTFTLDVINDSDTTNLLAALGMNAFFTGTDASDIAVDEKISNNPELIAASTGEVGNNTNSIRLAALQDNTSVISNTSFADYLHQIASALGEEANDTYKSEENFQALETNIGNRRDEISGVSVDEELVDLVRYQKAYQASAKYLATINRLTDVLLNSFG